MIRPAAVVSVALDYALPVTGGVLGWARAFHIPGADWLAGRIDRPQPIGRDPLDVGQPGAL